MKFTVLVSYAYARKAVRRFSELASRPDVELLLDSGAFTAKNTGEVITLDEYCAFLDEWKHKLFRYLALDVVGNPEGTDRNLQEMLRNGYKPVPVHVLGDDQRRMDELFEYSDYVALAGLRRPHKGGAPKAYVAAKMKWAAGRSVHWLGYVREPMIAAFRPYSVDSASWTSGQMYGVAKVYTGNGQWMDARYPTRAGLLNNKRAMRVLSEAGFAASDVNNPAAWRNGGPLDRFLLAAITADSWVRYSVDIQRRYGTRLFLATAMPGEHALFISALDRHASKLHLDTVSV
jgi:hypothetical protein